MRAATKLTVALLAGMALLLARPGLALDDTAQIRNLNLGKLDTAAPLYSALPESVRAAGKIVTGIIVGTPPSQFIEPGSREVQGFNIDLMQALSTELGVPFQVVPTDYGAFIPGLQSRRFDMVSAYIADTASRQQVVDFVDYYATQDFALGHRSSTLHIRSMDDLCGHSVAIDQGNYLIDLVQRQASKCLDEGREAIRLDIFQREASSRQAVLTRRADLTLSSGASALHTVKVTNGMLKIISERIGEPVLVGYPFLKGREDLRDAIAAAFDALIEKGEYLTVLQKWGLEDGALDKAYINQGPNAAAIVGP